MLFKEAQSESFSAFQRIYTPANGETVIIRNSDTVKCTVLENGVTIYAHGDGSWAGNDGNTYWEAFSIINVPGDEDDYLPIGWVDNESEALQY